MIHQPLARKWRVALGVASFVVLALVYTLLSYRQHGINPDDTTIPGWSQLWRGVEQIFTPNSHSGEIWLWVDFKATFGRLACGLAIGVAASIALGVLMGCYAPVEAFFHPPLSFTAKIPAILMLPIFFVIFGIAFEMYIALIAFGVLPTLTQAVYEAAKNDVPDELVSKASTLGASETETIWNVVVKHIFPKLLDNVRLQIGPAMIFLVAAEYAVGDEGFGYRVRNQLRTLNMSVIYSYLVILGLAGFTLDQALIQTRKKLCPWYGN